MQRGFLWIAVLATLCPAIALQAETPVTVPVDGENVTLVPPEGACVYDRANPMDAQVLDLMEKGNQNYNYVLMAFADCHDLDQMRHNPQAVATKDYGQILSPMAGRDAVSHPRAEFVRVMTDYYKKNSGIFEEGTQKAQTILKSLTNDQIKVGTAQNLGVIKEDPDFVQIGIIQTAQAGDKKVTLAGVITTTKLVVPVSINYFCPMVDENTIHGLSERSAAYTRKLIALNPDKAVAVTQQVQGSGVLQGALLGAALGGLIALAVKILRKKRTQP